MLSLAGPYLAVAALLALGGALKVVRPVETSTALGALNLPAHHGLVRALGVIEITIGAAAFATAAPLASTFMAGSYLGFAGFVMMARHAKTPVQSCGCFGKAETPPSLTHITVNLTAAAIAVATAVRPLPQLSELLANQPGAGIPLLMLTGVTIYVLYILLTALPQTNQALRTS